MNLNVRFSKYARNRADNFGPAQSTPQFHHESQRTPLGNCAILNRQLIQTIGMFGVLKTDLTARTAFPLRSVAETEYDGYDCSHQPRSRMLPGVSIQRLRGAGEWDRYSVALDHHRTPRGDCDGRARRKCNTG